MFKRISMIALALSMLGALTLGAGVARADDLKTKVDAAYSQVSKAFSAKDVNAFLALLASDYITVDEKGNAKTHEQSVDDAKRSLEMLQTGTITFKINDVQRVDDKTVKVKVLAHVAVSIDVEGKTRNVVSDEVAEDTWTTGEGGLKLQKSVTLEKKTTVDGQPVQ